MFRFIVVFCLLAVAIAKPRSCGKCYCSIDTQPLPGSSVSKSVLTVNCSKTGLSSYVNVPELSAFTFSEVILVSSWNKHDRIEVLEPGQITMLDLSDNEIRRIEPGAFKKMTKLIDVDLSHNKMNQVNFTSKSFSGLKNVQKLNLMAAEITVLGEDIFAEMKYLQELNLAHNFLEEKLPKNIFESNTNIETLNLAQNSLTGFEEGTFSKLKSLKNLNISSNLIAELSTNIFEENMGLEVLDVSRNKIQNLDLEFFENLKEIKVLDLSYNLMMQLEDRLEFGRELQVLNFAYNELKNVEFLYNQKLEGLHELYLQGNELTNVDFIETTPSLKILFLDSNQLVSLPTASLPNLSHLSLINNTFISVPNLINSASLPQLSRLYIDKNPIVDLRFPSNTSPFKHLRYISISYMPELTKITSLAFQGLASTRLNKREVKNGDDVIEDKQEGDMEEDEKKALEDGDDKDSEEELKSEERVLEWNENRELDESFEDVEENNGSEKSNGTVGKSMEEKGVMDEPNVQKETIINPDENVKKESVLGGFVMDVNNDEDSVHKESVEDVTDYERDLDGFTLPLKEERVSPQGAVPVARTMSGRTSGELREEECGAASGTGLYLRISGNKNLDTIEEGAFSGLDLCMLDISDNTLRTIPESLISWASVPAFDLQHNPWDCNCAQQWLLDAVVERLYVTRPELLYELRCGSPALLVNRRLVHYHGWQEKALCLEQRSRMVVSDKNEAGENGVSVVLKMAGSTSAVAVIVSCCALLAILVAAAIFLQWRSTNLRRRANRRL